MDVCDFPIATGTTFCDAVNAAGETSALGMADCDDDGVSNWMECNPPIGPPSDPQDECSIPAIFGNDFCAAVNAAGETSAIGMADCDGMHQDWQTVIVMAEE